MLERGPGRRRFAVTWMAIDRRRVSPIAPHCAVGAALLTLHFRRATSKPPASVRVYRRLMAAGDEWGFPDLCLGSALFLKSATPSAAVSKQEEGNHKDGND